MQNILSFASGIGGLDLAVRLALTNARTVCYIEREAFAVARLVELMQKEVLDDAPVWDDMRTFDGRAWRGIVDGIIGGYPCQPFSVAGKQRGKADERNLVEHVLRVVGEARPSWCYFENVGAHLRLGFREVKSELESLHYRVEAGLFSAAEVGAPHQRERLFIFAVSNSTNGNESQFTRGAAWSPSSENEVEHSARFVCKWSKRVGSATEQSEETNRNSSLEFPIFPPRPDAREQWQSILKWFPEIEPAIRGVADGIPAAVDGLTFREERLRALGNAVLPLTGAFGLVVLADRLGIAEDIGICQELLSILQSKRVNTA